MCSKKVIIRGVLFALLGALQAYSATSLTSGLVGYWDNNQTAGAHLDSVGNNHLTSFNAVLGSRGKIGNAADFDGSLKYLVGPANNSLSMPNRSFTISAWVRLNRKTPGIAVSKSRYEYYLGYGSAFGQNMFSDRFCFGIDGIGNVVEANSLGAPKANVWYHLVAWYDRSAQTVNIQVNNGPVDSRPQPNVTLPSGSPFWIGSWEGYNNYWDGSIDEVKIWNRALTSTERQQDYQNGLNQVEIVPSPSSSNVYVAPNGSPNGRGSITDPIDLVTALESDVTRVQPGGTLWLRGGRYQYRFMLVSDLAGLPNQPITVRSYPGEWATIDGWMTVQGSNMVMRNFEVTNTKTSRGLNDVQDGFLIFAPDSKFINLVVHDCIGDGIEFWASAINSELYGCLTYNNGFYDPVQRRKRGHNIYTQNLLGHKIIRDNISFHGFDTGLHIYTQDNYIQGYRISENISFDNTRNNILAGGVEPLQDVVFDSNYTYHQFGALQPSDVFGWSGYYNTNVTVVNNYIAGGSTPVNVGKFTGPIIFTNNTMVGFANTLSFNPITKALLKLHTWDYNTYYNREDNNYDRQFDAFRLSDFAGWVSDTGFDKHGSYTAGLPSANKIVVLPNQYEAGRANIAVYNWTLASSVQVNVSKAIAAGTPYEVRNALDFFGAPVLKGTYNGGQLTLPMNNSQTSPWFNAFVLVPTGATQQPTANTPPTITSVANQSTVGSSTVGPLPFTVGDAESSASSLTLSASSSNQNLLPSSGINLGGSGANRTVTLNPSGNTGTVTVTLSVSDGTDTSSTQFTLTITAPPVNNPPTISSIGSQTVTAGTTLGPLSFSVSDPETAAGNLSVLAQSSNQNLVSNSSISVGGSGGNRNITLTASSGVTGATVITVRVSDGVNTTTTQFGVTVTAPVVNSPPTLSTIPDQTAISGTVLGPYGFTVSDAQTSAGNLQVFARSSNQNLLHDTAITLGGSGANRTITLATTSGAVGFVTVTVTVSDGSQLTTTTFSLLLSAPAVNTPPGIGSISTQGSSAGNSYGPWTFGVWDNETPASQLSVSAHSSNQALVPDSAITLSGTGGTRDITFIPRNGAVGTTTITVTADDGQDTASTQFTISVAPPTVANDPPDIFFSKQLVVTMPDKAFLLPSVSDDGLPTPPGTISVKWQTISGPAPVFIERPRQAYTTARFKTSGTYVLRVTADDGQDASSLDVTVYVLPDPSSQGIPGSEISSGGSSTGSEPVSGESSDSLQESEEPAGALSAAGVELTSLNVPMATITAPASGMTLLSSGLLITVDVADDLDPVVGVDFFAGDEYLGNSTNRVGNTFSFLWRKAASGVAKVAATAITQSGILHAAYPVKAALGRFSDPLSDGAEVTVEGSSDLLHWDAVGSVTVTNGFFNLNDPASDNTSSRSYRLKIQ